MTGPLYGTVLIVVMILSSVLFDTTLSYQFYLIYFSLCIFNIKGQLIGIFILCYLKIHCVILSKGIIDVQSIIFTIVATAAQAEDVQMAKAYALPCLWLHEGLFLRARARR